MANKNNNQNQDYTTVWDMINRVYKPIGTGAAQTTRFGVPLPGINNGNPGGNVTNKLMELIVKMMSPGQANTPFKRPEMLI